MHFMYIAYCTQMYALKYTCTNSICSFLHRIQQTHTILIFMLAKYVSNLESNATM